VSLKDALDALSQSDFVRSIVKDEIINKYLAIKFSEWETYNKNSDKTDIDKQMYFKIL
jgi:glutamine synthetase